ncbi:TonB-dependent receptor plug domain-containing protein [Polluticoccus soli]|uniref:TonB-dependent receptor plug domain-containing protein n=1 Tax=Polluticoccus soli TaxID=3034150 RepID=UPI0023E1CA5F|nr:TonB-dependent receptor [Flavipsychrobacter sp. JY13-12]
MKRLVLAGLLCLFFQHNAFAQVTDTNRLQEVVISGIEATTSRQSCLNIVPLSRTELEFTSPNNLSDALSTVPGINQMRTGIAISKPVIRGLYGNRVLVLLSGLRFDNQQFQDEHGLGLSQIGIDRVEVIKGPASILYGTDAVGGIINIIEETPDLQGKFLDVNTRMYSNTLGTLTNVGYSSLKNNKWWRIRAGIETHADYLDGKGDRVLNSRNNGYYLKAGYGFKKGSWEQNNAYNFSYSQMGFIMEGLPQFFDEDNRGARAMSGPHHNVLLNVFSSQNTFDLKSSKLKINAGIQSNRRKEDEGGGEISLDMHLLSLLENARWEKPVSNNLQFVVNQQLTYENNTNYGKRILIPDAQMAENNLGAFLHYNLNKVVIEAGAGYNYKRIQTFKTGILNVGNDNTPDTSLGPISNNRGSFNMIAGLSYSPARWLLVKSNIATGNRAPNLAELSSNGLHEGTYRAEIGNPVLDMEQNINGDLEIELTGKKLFVSASGFYNHFANYIYLTLSEEPDWYGFPRYRYIQQDATLYGGEMIATVTPLNNLNIKETFSAVKGEFTTGGNLPFIPAFRSVSSVNYSRSDNTGRQLFFVEPELEYVFPQNDPAQFETTTVDYALVNIHAGTTARIKGNNVRLQASCKNLLDKAYTDHLSRIKYYGLYNQGINFIISASLQLKVK